MKIWEVIERLADDGDAVFENEDGKKIFLGKNGNVEQRAAWENTANPLVINVETILLSDWTRVPQSVPFHAKLYDCQQAYQEAAQSPLPVRKETQEYEQKNPQNKTNPKPKK